MSAADYPPEPNPFAARRIRPGAIAYRFPLGESLELLQERFEENGRRGQIVGPHGTGKSTLLAQWIDVLRQRGWTIRREDLHDGQRRLPHDAPPLLAASAPAVFVIDGCEQLSLWNRRRIKRACRASGWGLLVTAHDDVGLPTVHRTATSPAIAEQVVADLLGPRQKLVSGEQLAALYDQHHGNVRELLFALYDLHERARRQRDARDD